MKSRKAQTLPTNTIIILVLGLVVLALLILYFTGGMKNLWSEIQQRAGIVSGSEYEAREMCNAWCNVENKEVCTHTFNFKDGDKTIKKSCVSGVSDTSGNLGVTCPICSA